MEVVGMGSMLAICSAFDLWKKQIPMVVLLVFGITGVWYQIQYGHLPRWDVVLGVMVGVVVYCISIVSDERIGKGDALMLMSSGVYMGFWKNITLLWLGSTMAGILCMVMRFCMKKGKNATVPFAPFLLGAYLVLWLVGGVRE